MTESPSEVAVRLADLLDRQPPVGVLSIYLFGGHAEGRSHRESDVDLGVLLDRNRYPTPAERFDVRLRLTTWLQAELGAGSVDLVVLNDVPPTLARRIVTRGTPVFRADTEADHAFVRDTQLLAADLEPFLRRTRALKRQALRG